MSDNITDFVSWITSSKKYATASPRTQLMLFAGFEAGRQADEGQSVGVAEPWAPSPGMTQCVFTAKAVPVGAKLYARPVSADVPDGGKPFAYVDAEEKWWIDNSKNVTETKCFVEKKYASDVPLYARPVRVDMLAEQILRETWGGNGE